MTPTIDGEPVPAEAARRPIFAAARQPECTAAIRAIATRSDGRNHVFVMIDRGTRLPGLDLSIDPVAALHLARELIRCVKEGRDLTRYLDENGITGV